MSEDEVIELIRKIGDEFEKELPDHDWIDEQLARVQEYLDLQK